MVRSPLVWLGERDPVESVEKIRREDPELNDIREFFAMWLNYDLGLDTDYMAARLIELACIPPAPNDYNPPSMKLLLLRLAGDKTGEISAHRLGLWLRKISGRVVDGYRLIRGNNYGPRAQFRLTKVSP
jgi:putative DNA primase/helicase